MERIGVREARQNLSVYLERVKHGEAFTVTEHGHPVALLSPVPADDDPLADLVAAGRATPATARLADLPDALPALPGPPASPPAAVSRSWPPAAPPAPLPPLPAAAAPPTPTSPKPPPKRPPTAAPPAWC